MPRKRRDIYHSDFVVDGRRYRQSLHTRDRRVARDRERDLAKQAKEGRLAATSGRRSLLFRQAAQQFIDDPAEPDHYIFFACEGKVLDPSKPQKSWRSAWRSLRKVAGLPKLRFHDLRHQAITELAEGQASDQVIRDIAGHVSNRMLEHYSHIRLQAKRTALDALSSKRPSHDTNHVTKQVFQGEHSRQVTEKMVGSAGLEPAASSL